MGIFFNRKKSKPIAETTITAKTRTREVSRAYADKVSSGYIESNGKLYPPTTVFVSKNGGEVYHKDRHCSGMNITLNAIPMTEEQAIRKGLRSCKNCKNYDYKKFL